MLEEDIEILRNETQTAEEYLTCECTKPYKSKRKIFVIIIILIIIFSLIAGALLLKFYPKKSDTYGMLPQNFGTVYNITSSENYIFHSYVSDKHIRRIDKKTKETILFDFCGNYINVMGDSLYYVSNDKIFTCGLDGKNPTEIPFVIPEYSEPDFIGMYATKKGLFLHFNTNSEFSYYLLPYDSKYPVKMKNMPKTTLFTKDGYYAVLDGYLLLFNFEEPDVATTYFVHADVNPRNVYYENNTIVYAVDNIIYERNTITGGLRVLYTARNGIIRLNNLYDEYIYFYIKEENNSLITEETSFYVINPEGVPTEIGKGLYPVSINFANDKLFFCDGMSIVSPGKRDSYMCNLDGSELTRID